MQLKALHRVCVASDYHCCAWHWHGRCSQAWHEQRGAQVPLQIVLEHSCVHRLPIVWYLCARCLHAGASGLKEFRTLFAQALSPYLKHTGPTHHHTFISSCLAIITILDSLSVDLALPRRHGAGSIKSAAPVGARLIWPTQAWCRLYQSAEHAYDKLTCSGRLHTPSACIATGGQHVALCQRDQGSLARSTKRKASCGGCGGGVNSLEFDHLVRRWGCEAKQRA